jgi:hypothetical protein
MEIMIIDEGLARATRVHANPQHHRDTSPSQGNSLT